jgi:hypothetical protein
MYCSGCGNALAQGQLVCPQCGHQVAPPVPPVPGLQFEVENYSSKIRVLSMFWFIYAGVGFVFGVAGLTFAKAFFSGAMGPWGGPWMHGPMPFFMGPAFLHMIWVLILLRSLLAAAAGWGLMEHTQWGRMVAIVAAVFSLLKFPFGTAMGIWTLVVLIGYRNQALYEQL